MSLRDFADRIVPLDEGRDPLERHDAETTRFVLLAFLMVGLGLFAGLLAIWAVGAHSWEEARTQRMAAALLTNTLGSAAGLVALSRGHIAAAKALAVGTAFVGVTFAAWLGGELPNRGLYNYMIVVAAAGVLYHARGSIVTGLLCLATVFGLLTLRQWVPALPERSPHEAVHLMAAVVTLGVVISAMLWHTNRGARRAMRKVIDQQHALEQRNRELRASEQRLETLVAQTRELIAEVDADGRLVYVSPNHLEVTGRSAAEHIGHHVTDFVHPRDVATRSGSMPPPGEICEPFRIRLADGSWRWVEVSFTPVQEASGETRLLSITRDVTTRVAAEEQARERRAAASHAQKMEALGRLAGGMTHELNNLMTAITLNADLLESDDDLPKHAATQIGQIRDSAEQATALTRRLLGFSRSSKRVHKALELDAELGDLAALLRPLVGERVSFDLDLAAGGACVEMDPTDLAQLTMNLVLNASEAVGEEADVRVRSESLVLDAPLACHAGRMPAGRYVALTVSDTGEGMDDETRERMFEPFFTRRADEGASGLGLALVYGVARRAGGDIRVESRLGGGTSITVYLPQAQAARPEVAAARPRSADPRGDETVLVVEDRSGVRDVVAEVVRSLGYRVLAAGSAAEALEVERSFEGPIHLLLTDVVMPGVQGPDLAAQLRARRPRMPVIFLTAYASGVLEPGASQPGKVLYKPTNRAELARALREALAGRAPSDAVTATTPPPPGPPAA